MTLPEMEKGYRHDKDRISLRYLLFQYNVLEAATAIKPFFLEYLLQKNLEVG